MKDNMKRAPFSTQIDLSKFDMKDFAKASDEEKRQQEVMEIGRASCRERV